MHEISSLLPNLSSSAQQQLSNLGVQRASELKHSQMLPSGIQEIDQLLHGGLPCPAVIECGMPAGRMGRQVLLPFITQLQRTLWIYPPELVIYAPAWEEAGVPLDKVHFIQAPERIMTLRPLFMTQFYQLIVWDLPSAAPHPFGGSEANRTRYPGDPLLQKAAFRPQLQKAASGTQLQKAATGTQFPIATSGTLGSRQPANKRGKARAEDFAFFRSQAEKHHYSMMIVRPYFLSRQRGNPLASLRINCWFQEDSFHLQVIRGRSDETVKFQL